MADFRKLRVWVAAQELAREAFLCSTRMRGFGSTTLGNQLLRAAMSVPANIAEGSAHSSRKEFARFLRYAIASTAEVETHVMLGRDLELIKESDSFSLISRTIRIRKMLLALHKKVKSSVRP
ncbi:MAG TPA: four helix bundle protein [Gemmatimonadaceae bacterium]